jgi:hypothetical protein
MSINWTVAVMAFLRPVLYLILWVCVIYWVKLFLWKIIPNGKVKEFLFKRRGT